MAKCELRMRVVPPWWMGAFVGACIVLARLGMHIDEKRAAKFVARFLKVEFYT